MFGNEHVNEILITVAFWACILSSCVGIALGVGLNFSSERTLRFLKASNRRVSPGKTPEPLASPVDIDKAVFKRRRLSAAFFILGGAYTVFMLLFVVDFPYVVFALSESANPGIVAILIESLKWFLVLGGSLAFVVGVAMLVSENALPSLRAKLDRWRSAGNISKASGEMNMALDNITGAYPRATGLALIVISVSALIASVVVWTNY